MSNHSLFSGLSKKARIGFVVSVVWLIVVLVFAMESASKYRYIQDFIGIFLVFGFLPVTIGWGIRWIGMKK